MDDTDIVALAEQVRTELPALLLSDEDVYRGIADNGELRPTAAAEALHDAVRRQRDNAPTEPSNWAPFIHLGP